MERKQHTGKCEGSIKTIAFTLKSKHGVGLMSVTRREREAGLCLGNAEDT